MRRVKGAAPQHLAHQDRALELLRWLPEFRYSKVSVERADRHHARTYTADGSRPMSQTGSTL